MLAALLFGCGVSGVQPANDALTISGTWTVVAQRKDDRESAPSEIKGMKIAIGAKMLRIISLEVAKGGGTYEFKQELMYNLDSSKNPKAIDLGCLAFRATKGENGAKDPEVVETWYGIYEFNEDSLRIAFDRGRGAKKMEDGSFEYKGKSAIRPKNFDGGPSITVFTLKREKKGE